MRLKVSPNRRFLMYENRSPFFYLGDTAWELFHRLNREEADLYLRDRAAKKFTVIQAVALAELDGLNDPDPYGHRPLQDNDPTKPNDDYFQHVDWIVNRAASLGLTLGFLPTWGDKFNPKWAKNSEVIFTPENARVYGEFLGRRYRSSPLIWILGGDRPLETEAQKRIVRAMAEGLRAGDGGAHRMTFHPSGGQSSADFVHEEAWLDFHMIQSGHGRRDGENWRMIAADYGRVPTRPCMDGEPCYENHPVNWQPEEKGWFDQYDARKAAYWALFAGAHGHAYGCHDIWQMLEPGRRQPVGHARGSWKESLHLPGASQMQHARKLLESRPFFTRAPDQSLLASEPGAGGAHVQATRAGDGAYAFVYSPMGKPVTIRMEKLSESQAKAHWFDPRTGKATVIGQFPTRGEREFTPPSSGAGNDWILTLDDAARGFSTPGA